FGQSRWQPGQIEGNAANQRQPVRFRRRPKSLLFPPTQHEIVQRILWPAWVLYIWKFGTLGGNERPVLFPVGALLDPAAQQGNLTVRESTARGNRGHSFRWVGGRNPPDHFALDRIARHNCETAPTLILPGRSLDVKAQFRHAGRRVRPVTGITLVRKDRPDV